nr:hypothetical protein [Tanacetum cinerariifolium]
MSDKKTIWNEFSSSMASVVICLATVLINTQVDDLSSHTTKYTCLALTQKVFANMRRIGKGFSSIETPLFATMLVQPQVVAEEEDEEDEVHAAPTPPSPTHEPTPPLQELITSRPPAQYTCTTLSHKVAALEQDKVAQALEILKLKRRVKKLEKQRRSKSSGLKGLRKVGAKLQGRLGEKHEVNAAAKEVNAAEPIMDKRLHDEEVEQAAAREKQEQDDFKKAQELQQQYDQKQENIDWNVMVEQMQEKHLDNIRKYQSLKRKPTSVAQAKKNMTVRPSFEREYNKVQTILKPDRDEELAKKREDVKNMLQIVPVAELKVEALQVRVGGITQAYRSFEDMLKDFDREDLDALWRLTKEKFSTAMPIEDKEKALLIELKRVYEPNAADVFWKLPGNMHDPLTWKLYTNCRVHQVSSTRRYEIFMFTEKDYPLTNVVLLLMLSTQIQVYEDCEMAMDLVMKIFMEANRPKSRRSLDTSS